MADERASHDVNYRPVITAVKDSSGEITQVRVDDTTKRLLVDNNALPANTAGIIIGDISSSIRLVASGFIQFGEEPTDDVLTTEKLTASSTLSLGTSTRIHSDSLYLLAIERPASTAYPGDLTINTYNVLDMSSSGESNILHTTHVISSAIITTGRDFLVQGLFVGNKADNQANLGFSYATDVNETLKIYYKILKL